MSASRLSVVVFSVFVAMVLIGLAVPRLAGGVFAGPFDETVRILGRGGEVSKSQTRLARASRVTTLDWYANARIASELGALNYTLATREARGSEARIANIAAAIESDRLAVSLAPTSAFSWMRLAQAHVERDGARADIAPYLRMSYRTAPYDPRILFPRLDFVLAVWDDLPEDLKAVAGEQIRVAMEWAPLELVRRTRARYRLAEVRDALRDEPAARARFNLLYLLRRDAV